jgi:DNA replication protein DnaC
MPDRQAELRQMLRTLKLPAMARLFGDLALRAAKAELTHEAYLFELVQAECAQREERRLARLQRASGLPLEKSFHTLKLARFSPTIRQQVEQLRTGSFVAEAVNVIAVGPPGAGKSHLLAAIGQELVSQGHPVLWTATATLMQRLLAAKRDLRLPQELARLDRYACLILDDIGYVQHDRDEMEVLFTLLAERYERRSVALSTNLVFSEWERIFKDPLTTLAAIDRLVHHAAILDLMQVTSYRAHTATTQHRRPAPAASEPAPSQEADQETDRDAPSP